MLWTFCQYSIWSSDRFLWVLLDDLNKHMHVFQIFILGKPEGLHCFGVSIQNKVKESILHLNHFLPGGFM